MDGNDQVGRPRKLCKMAIIKICMNKNLLLAGKNVLVIWINQFLLQFRLGRFLIRFLIFMKEIIDGWLPQKKEPAWSCMAETGSCIFGYQSDKFLPGDSYNVI